MGWWRLWRWRKWKKILGNGIFLEKEEKKGKFSYERKYGFLFWLFLLLLLCTIRKCSYPKNRNKVLSFPFLESLSSLLTLESLFCNENAYFLFRTQNTQKLSFFVHFDVFLRFFWSFFLTVIFLYRLIVDEDSSSSISFQRTFLRICGIFEPRIRRRSANSKKRTNPLLFFLRILSLLGKKQVNLCVSEEETLSLSFSSLFFFFCYLFVTSSRISLKTEFSLIC